MKIRQGFVSNSSSSSFIISAPKGVIPKGKITVEIKNFIESAIETTSDLDEYMQDQYGNDWENDSDGKKLYRKIEKAIDTGEVVYLCSCSTEDDEDMSSYLATNGLKNVTGKNFKIVGDKGGF